MANTDLAIQAAARHVSGESAAMIVDILQRVAAKNNGDLSNRYTITLDLPKDERYPLANLCDDNPDMQADIDMFYASCGHAMAAAENALDAAAMVIRGKK